MFTHKIFFGRAALPRRPNFSAEAERQLGPTNFVFDPGNKKAPTLDEKGPTHSARASHFSQANGA